MAFWITSIRVQLINIIWVKFYKPFFKKHSGYGLPLNFASDMKEI